MSQFVLNQPVLSGWIFGIAAMAWILSGWLSRRTGLFPMNAYARMGQ